MKNSKKRIWARHESLTTIAGEYITLFFVVPVLSLCFSALAHSKEIDAGVPDAVKNALLTGLMWGGIVVAILTVLFAILFLLYSDTVEFTDTDIKYYRWIFSKKSRSFVYDEIAKCICQCGLWRRKGNYIRGKKILIYHKDALILQLDLYDKLCLALILQLNGGKDRVYLADDDFHARTVDNYFKLKFMDLSSADQMTLLKHYRKHADGKPGAEILGKKI